MYHGTQDAIAANSFFPDIPRINKGNFSSAYQDSPITLEGQVRVGGQEHFYLEPHGCLVVPKGENNEMEIFSSTQNLDGTQKMAAKALGVPANRITASVKRIGKQFSSSIATLIHVMIFFCFVGGGFGGKGSRSCMFSVTTAVAARKSVVLIFCVRYCYGNNEGARGLFE